MLLSRTHFLVLLFTLSTGITLSAQDRVTEAEIELQKIFIEASQQKVLENYDAAIALFEQILKKDKQNHAAAYELARIYVSKEEEAKADKYIKIALDLDQENVWYQKLRAEIFQKAGKNEEAAKIYEQLAKSAPDNEYYYGQWAYHLIKSEQISEALKVYDELEQKIGVNEELARRKFTLYIGQGNTKKALKELENLIEAYPAELEYRHLLASFYEQSGEEDKAKATYETILSIDANDVKAKLGLAGMSGQSQNELLYLETLESIFENPDVDIDVKIEKIFPFIGKVAETGDPNVAAATIKLTDILERVHPNEAKAFSAAGDLRYYSGKRLEALEKYKKTIELDESVFMVWEQVLYIYLQEGDYPALLKTAESALDIYPNQAIVYFMAAIANDNLENPEDAVDMYEQALFMSGNNQQLQLDIYSRLGSVYHTMKDYTKSDAAFEQALKINENDPSVLNNYSYYLSVRGTQLERAKAMSAKSNELVPNQASFQDTYGWILYKLKEYKDAKEWLQKALSNGGNNSATILEHFGDVLFQLNDIDQAIQYWTKALEAGSKSELLEKKIADRKLYE